MRQFLNIIAHATILDQFDIFKLEETSLYIFFSHLFVIFYNDSYHFFTSSYLLKLLNHSSPMLLVSCK